MDVICKAKLETGKTGQVMRCHRCRLLWDIPNNDPPRCLTADEIKNHPLYPIIRQIGAAAVATATGSKR